MSKSTKNKSSNNNKKNGVLIPKWAIVIVIILILFLLAGIAKAIIGNRNISFYVDNVTYDYYTFNADGTEEVRPSISFSLYADEKVDAAKSGRGCGELVNLLNDLIGGDENVTETD